MKDTSNSINRAHPRAQAHGFAAYFGAMRTRTGLLLLLLAASATAANKPIDRHALVTRHNPTITSIDKSAPFMVGNGNLAFTADITGLQTFPEQYSALSPFFIQSQ